MINEKADMSMGNALHDFEKLLFSRGFALYPEKVNISYNVCSELGAWKTTSLGSYILCSHPDATVYKEVSSKHAVLLVGNAVNPFDGTLESDIVKKLLALCEPFASGSNLNDGKLSADVVEYIDQLTGRFQAFIVIDSQVFAFCDATGLAPLYVSWHDEYYSFSSHSQLLAELTGAERDPEIQEIIDSSFFMVGRSHLPGYKSPFENIEIVGSNVYFSTSLDRRVRVFPCDPLDAEGDIAGLVEESSMLLKRTAGLYVDSRAMLVSLSMGQDSRIGLAAFHDWRHKISAYSYCGNPVETDEAERVHEFARRIGVKHDIVRTDNVNEEEQRSLAAVLDRSTAYMRKHRPSEISKLVAMLHWFPAGAIEAKGEASEAGRATYSKRTGIKSFPPLSPRSMSNLYKRVLYPRHLLKRIDGYFEEFCDQGGFGFSDIGYDDYDMFFWEHRTACCVSLGMQDHDIYHDSTAPGKTHEKPLYDGPRSALPIGAHMVI